ncbi:hypothetical protein ACFL7D_06400 [candidate division KSB1 bacterium]
MEDELNESVKVATRHFRELLLNGKIEEAMDFMHRNEVPEQSVNQIVQEAFSLHKETEQFDLALLMTQHFNLSEEERRGVIVSEWNRLNKVEEYEEAVKWAVKNELSDSEVIRSAKMAYEKYISENRVDEAISILETYEISKEDVLAFTINHFNTAVENEENYKAAILGETFNFSAKRTYISAMKVCEENMTEGNLADAVKILQKFKFFVIDVYSEIPDNDYREFLKNLLAKLVSPGFKKKKFSLMRDMSKEFLFNVNNKDVKIFEDFSREFYKYAIKAFNSMLENDDEESAEFLQDSFNLFTAPVSFELYSSMIIAAEKFHFSILKAGDLNEAIKFKSKFSLFSQNTIESSKNTMIHQGSSFFILALKKGKISDAKRAIDEYRLSKEIVIDSVFKAVFSLLDNKEHSRVNEVLDNFSTNFSNEENKIRAVNKFNELMQEKSFLFAGEFALKLKLKKNLIDDAAYKAWHSEFLDGKYDEALEIREKFKINKKNTMNVIRETYNDLMNKQEYTAAIVLRKEYSMPIGFTEWLQELLRVIFSK